MYSCTLKGSMTFSSFSARYFEKGEISKTPHLKKNVSKYKFKFKIAAYFKSSYKHAVHFNNNLENLVNSYVLKLSQFCKF